MYSSYTGTGHNNQTAQGIQPKRRVSSNNSGEAGGKAQYQDQAGHHNAIERWETDSTEIDRYEKTAMELDGTGQEPHLWRYTSSSGAKDLEKIKDAHRYVDSMIEIWHVPRTIQAEEFVKDLHEAVDNVKNVYGREFFIKDDRNMIIHLVVAIRSLKGQMREIHYCLQQVTVSSMSNKGEQETSLLDKPSAQWLRTKAAERLGFHAKVINASHSLHVDMSDGQHGNYSGTDMQSNASSGLSCRPS